MGFWIGILIGVIMLPYLIGFYVIAKTPVITGPRRGSVKPVNLKNIVRKIKKYITIGSQWTQGYACGTCSILWKKRDHGQTCPRCNSKGVELKYRAND